MVSNCSGARSGIGSAETRHRTDPVRCGSRPVRARSHRFNIVVALEIGRPPVLPARQRTGHRPIAEIPIGIAIHSPIGCSILVGTDLPGRGFPGAVQLPAGVLPQQGTAGRGDQGKTVTVHLAVSSVTWTDQLPGAALPSSGPVTPWDQVVGKSAPFSEITSAASTIRFVLLVLVEGQFRPGRQRHCSCSGRLWHTSHPDRATRSHRCPVAGPADMVGRGLDSHSIQISYTGKQTGRGIYLKELPVVHIRRWLVCLAAGLGPPVIAATVGWNHRVPVPTVRSASISPLPNQQGGAFAYFSRVAPRLCRLYSTSTPLPLGVSTGWHLTRRDRTCLDHQIITVGISLLDMHLMNKSADAGTSTWKASTL